MYVANTTASSSLTATGSDNGAISSKEISSLPSTHRMSAYHSKYLHEKERQQGELSTEPSKDTASSTADLKNGKIARLNNKKLSCCCNSWSYYVRHKYNVRYSYSPLCGIAVVSMSIYLFTVSKWSLLLMPVTFFSRSLCFVVKRYIQQQNVSQEVNNKCHAWMVTFNPILTWVPQCSASQTDW